MHTQAKRSWRFLALKLRLLAAELKHDELDRELQALRAAADAPDSDDDSDDSMLTQPPLSDDFEITAKPVAARTRSQRG
tara:strand:+ start:65 stop:301 length:237 start_codon:yes stop_codon:yes gene_type:complete